ncbi:MAG: alpha/beta hydrolase [Proteobacteria bacterium]|nr:alpha/beta hydrolase [Pseudomonadota bacterium]
MDVPDPDSPSPAAVPIDLAATYRPADRYGWLAVPAARLRYGCWNASGTATRGTVVVLTGRGEFIEKYATEIVGELLGRGYAVVALDWRGQGLSDRPLPQEHDAGHIDRFETYMTDLKVFLDAIVAPFAEGPVFALCHSMGGHILLRALAECGSAPFAAAVVTSPMTGLQREAFLRSILMLLPEIPTIEHRYLFGTGPFVFLARDFHSNNVTHDERRYRWTEAWFAAEPRLSLGGPTVGWARQAARSISACLAPGYLERIDLPVLLMTAGQDQIINPASHGSVAARIPHAEHVSFAGARHEIMMETDDIRARFWAAFDGFVNSLSG